MFNRQLSYPVARGGVQLAGDRLAVDESFQPTAVGFAEALNNKDKPEDAVLDVQGIATVTPAIVQACTQDKKASFKDKVKGEWDKIKKDM